ncbi:MAG: hypothetical protein M1826_002238 [Phylliscum demangeonii]|nr:MAG: hypothetical protein M1826_002238 [Phylliscum demangeonii]
MTSATQLLLLADHVKLSLLERQRAISLDLEPNAQDGHISRSLAALREGIEEMGRERGRLDGLGDSAGSRTMQAQEDRLRAQLDDLSAQFHGFSHSPLLASITQPNDPSLSSTFSLAASTRSTAAAARPSADRPRIPSTSSFLKRATGPGIAKSVHFSDHASAAPAPAATLDGGIDNDDNNRNPGRPAAAAALFPYRDDPDPRAVADGLDNERLHAFHTQVLRDQDDQLDRLGESIGRQRELTIQIGDELDSQVQLLDEVDEHVDRHQTRLDLARQRLGTFARGAKDNMQLTVIVVLIVILVLLILVLK